MADQGLVPCDRFLGRLVRLIFGGTVGLGGTKLRLEGAVGLVHDGLRRLVAVPVLGGVRDLVISNGAVPGAGAGSGILPSAVRSSRWYLASTSSLRPRISSGV